MGLALEWPFAVYTFVKWNTQGPPVNLTEIATASEHFGRQVCEGARFAGEQFRRSEVRGHVKIGQMYMALHIEEDVVWLDVSMHDALAVYISQSTSQLRHPKSYCIFRKGLPMDMESKISAGHQVHDEVHVFDILKTVP